MQRRQFLFSAAALAAPALLAKAGLTRKERVDRALAGRDVDRTPFTFWHHFGLNTAEDHARATLDFHRAYRTDLVKVMSDFPYPKPAGKWFELKPLDNPFPAQIRSLELIRDGLKGDAHFVETLFNPWNVAEKLSSADEVQRLKRENPQALYHALEAIAQSEIRHSRLALKAGAAGVFLSVANAKPDVLSREDYINFSLPFDRKILQAVASERLNVLHLHVEKSHLDLFHDFPVTAINYSIPVSGIPFAEVRGQYRSALMGGIDEVNYRKLSAEEIRRQWNAAQEAAGKRFLLAPGCSVPNDSTPAELSRLPGVVGA
jgi:uroporphyrinogen decarboxylase